MKTSDLLQIITRWLAAALAGVILKHASGHIGADNAQAAAEGLIGAAMGVVGVMWSKMHLNKALNTPAPSQTNASSGILKALLVSCLLSSVVLTGCKAGPERAAYNSVNVPAVAADAAMKAWGDYVAQYHPGVDAERKVLAAYKNYKMAELAAIDIAQLAGSAAASTNSFTAAAVSAAQSPQASQALSDLLNLIRSFGVKL